MLECDNQEIKSSVKNSWMIVDLSTLHCPAGDLSEGSAGVNEVPDQLTGAGSEITRRAAGFFSDG
jgi:hypothetical protein